MSKFYLLSPSGVPPNPHLFPIWVDSWKRKGIEIVDRIEDCRVVLFDLHTRISYYKQSDIDYICNLHSPVFVATFDEWDRGGMSSDIWPHPLTGQQKLVIGSTINRSVHFCRLLDKVQTYHLNIYPYEKSIFYEEPMLTANELFNRPYDVCFIANSAPSRERIAEALRSDSRLNCIIRLGEQKIPVNEFLDIHKKAKLFVSSSAGGYGNERPQLLFSVASMIQEETDQLLLHPFLNMENCVKVKNPLTPLDLDAIYEVVNDKERLYWIYKNNYEFMKQYYSKEYIANDILTKILHHA